MPTLTEDMKEEIWKSYHETKRFTETAKRLDIDPRTVAGVVKKKKIALAVKTLLIRRRMILPIFLAFKK